uniref:Type VI secretion protein, VC_A0107 family n=1 Tax=Geobacter sp. (strain M21) TaxID=443144 RepID=C6E3K3_GEOSM
MAKSESLQHKLERVRAPRVRITYDVETGGGIEMKEIPFVVGVLADLSGKPDQPLPRLKERSFVEVDRDNIDSVLEGMRPRAAFRVPNRLVEDGSQLAVDLRFTSLDDFHPEKVALQVEPLRRLVEARKRLSDLLARLDGNDRLEQLLRGALSSPDALKLICEEAKSAKAPDTESAG